MSPEEHAAMIAPRRTLAAERPSILTTLTPQDRIPSVGVQLSTDGTADLSRTGRPVPAFGAAPAARGAAPLNLWDTSADNLPETWSL